MRDNTVCKNSLLSFKVASRLESKLTKPSSTWSGWKLWREAILSCPSVNVSRSVATCIKLLALSTDNRTLVLSHT
ncbi:hypothetical protein CEXT_238431 [Caerostris extrusa]|uniref:Uncharacterized protein n=1 Tax=Caerostris extrusa TaxID=172846 RepID=A0AAV4T338_CAEEX|nr:hypothetical protein CEXT_238431 [Caerostris extrusa]